MLWILLLLAGLSPAEAQAPIDLGGLGGAGLAGLTLPAANTRYLAADVVSKRFPGEDLAGPTFKTGEQVEVIVEEGGRTRIHQGERYGWVPSSQLVSMAPPPELAAPASNPLLGGLPPAAPPTPGPRP